MPAVALQPITRILHLHRRHHTKKNSPTSRALLTTFQAGLHSSGAADASLSKDASALARIETEKAKLSSGLGRHTADELVMQELLGEGTFGKVGLPLLTWLDLAWVN